MLIITRRPGEKVMLGDDVVVEVIEVSGSSVRIGIAAPKSVPVYREEIWRGGQGGERGRRRVRRHRLPDDVPRPSETRYSPADTPPRRNHNRCPCGSTTTSRR